MMTITEAVTKVTAPELYDNKPVYLVSAYRGRHPVETVKRWHLAERFQDQHGQRIQLPHRS